MYSAPLRRLTHALGLTLMLTIRRLGGRCDQRRVGAPDMTGFETSPAWMASVRAASFGHASAPASCAEPSSGPEIPSHAQPRVCVRKATQENGAVRCTHAASARPRTGSVSHVIHGGRVLTLAHACAFAARRRSGRLEAKRARPTRRPTLLLRTSAPHTHLTARRTMRRQTTAPDGPGPPLSRTACLSPPARRWPARRWEAGSLACPLGTFRAPSASSFPNGSARSSRARRRSREATRR